MIGCSYVLLNVCHRGHCARNQSHSSLGRGKFYSLPPRTLFLPYFHTYLVWDSTIKETLREDMLCLLSFVCLRLESLAGVWPVSAPEAETLKRTVSGANKTNCGMLNLVGLLFYLGWAGCAGGLTRYEPAVYYWYWFHLHSIHVCELFEARKSAIEVRTLTTPSLGTHSMPPLQPTLVLLPTQL